MQNKSYRKSQLLTRLKISVYAAEAMWNATNMVHMTIRSEETQVMIFHAGKVQADRKHAKSIIGAVLGQMNQTIENFDNEFLDLIRAIMRYAKTKNLPSWNKHT
jgi:hypothetical protein